MITKAQEHQIDFYLYSRKLYPQLHDEVKDHFISQILHLMNERSLSFQEAFLETKISWKNELEMVKADLFSFKKVAKIEKSILQQRFHKMTVFAFVFSAVGFGFLQINTDLFVGFQILLLLGWLILLGYSIITKKMRFNNYITLSFHPLLIKNIVVGIALLLFAGLLKYDYHEIIYLKVSKLFLIYSMTIQLQLIYFNSKKINVLI